MPTKLTDALSTPLLALNYLMPLTYLLTDVRRRALREMCPCRVKQDLDDFWKRVLEMTHDPDPVVRQQVSYGLHIA